MKLIILVVILLVFGAKRLPEKALKTRGKHPDVQERRNRRRSKVQSETTSVTKRVLRNISSKSP